MVLQDNIQPIHHTSTISRSVNVRKRKSIYVDSNSQRRFIEGCGTLWGFRYRQQQAIQVCETAWENV